MTRYVVRRRSTPLVAELLTLDHSGTGVTATILIARIVAAHHLRVAMIHRRPSRLKIDSDVVTGGRLNQSMVPAIDRAAAADVDGCGDDEDEHPIDLDTAIAMPLPTTPRQAEDGRSGASADPSFLEEGRKESPRHGRRFEALQLAAAAIPTRSIRRGIRRRAAGTKPMVAPTNWTRRRRLKIVRAIPQLAGRANQSGRQRLRNSTRSGAVTRTRRR